LNQACASGVALMERRLLPMPVIFTGTGNDSGAGSAFICMPLWHADALWAELRDEATHNVTIAVAIQQMRRTRAEQDMVTLSDVAIQRLAHRAAGCVLDDVGGSRTQYTCVEEHFS
jgi:hypothetical protein